MAQTAARLLRLLTTLQTRRHWSGPELAERLEVTGRTLRRDVERLRALGYAVEAFSGPGGGYRLGKGKALPPLLLGDDEAVALAAALRSSVDTFAGAGDTVLAALVKLEQLLPHRLRRRLDALQSMTVSIGSGPRLDPEVLVTLAAACRDGVRLGFVYRAHDGALSERRVEPLRLAHTGNRRWYLVAWDLEREAWRTFRVDRVERPVSAERFAPRPTPADLERYVSESISVVSYRRRARLLLPGSAAAMAERLPPWIGTLEPRDETTSVLTIGGPDWNALVAQLVIAGVEFEVLEPPELLEELGRIARRLASSARAPRARRRSA